MRSHRWPIGHKVSLGGSATTYWPRPSQKSPDRLTKYFRYMLFEYKHIYKYKYTSSKRMYLFQDSKSCRFDSLFDCLVICIHAFHHVCLRSNKWFTVHFTQWCTHFPSSTKIMLLSSRYPHPIGLSPVVSVAGAHCFYSEVTKETYAGLILASFKYPGQSSYPKNKWGREN